MVADNTLRLQAHVPERYLGDVRKDAIVTFRVEAYPNETFEGRVAIIDPAVDAASRTFRIEAMVDNAKYGNRLRPGSFVPGEVLTKKEPDRLMVPLTAITSFVGVTKIYKVDAKANPPAVLAVVVEKGQDEIIKDAQGKDEHWVEILKADQPLTANDRVATSGLGKLVNGSLIVERAPEPATPAAAAR
jgi:membrane fusion protein (multidrug efflux system)